jgi:hypothetical protein
MDTPPPYNSYQPKKSKTGLIVALILGGVTLCCILPLLAVGGGAFWFKQKFSGLASCTITISSISTALREYADEHDGKLPKAETWQTDIAPYYEKFINRPNQKQNIFPPARPNEPWGCKGEDEGSTGLAFNSDLSGKKIDDIKDQSKAIVVFELPKSGMNLHEPYKPQKFDDSPMMLGKHRGWYTVKANGMMTIANRNGFEKNVPVNGMDNGVNVEVQDDGKDQNVEVHGDGNKVIKVKGGGNDVQINVGDK